MRNTVGKTRSGTIRSTKMREAAKAAVRGRCLCGAVVIAIGHPARWAWHDHSKTSRHAHGAAYATYVGSWRSRFRIVEGAEHIARYEDKEKKWSRSFCSRCGTPLIYERTRAPQMVNLPRALFDAGTGREPLYHIAMDERPDWAYSGAPLGPLKGYPGVLWERPKRRKREILGDPLDQVLREGLQSEEDA